jgi:hypothetical protein
MVCDQSQRKDFVDHAEAIKYQQDINEQVKLRYSSLQNSVFRYVFNQADPKELSDLLETKDGALNKQKSMTQKYRNAGYALRKQTDGLQSQTRQYMHADKKRNVSRENTAEYAKY